MNPGHRFRAILFLVWGILFTIFAVLVTFFVDHFQVPSLARVLLAVAGLFWFFGYLVHLHDRYMVRGEHPYAWLPRRLVPLVLALHYLAALAAPVLLMLVLLLLTGRVTLVG
jgi:hypothetical protein